MSAKQRSEQQRSPGPFQFSLRTLFGATAGWAALFALARWSQHPLLTALCGTVAGLFVFAVGDYTNRPGLVAGGLLFCAAASFLIVLLLAGVGL